MQNQNHLLRDYRKLPDALSAGVNLLGKFAGHRLSVFLDYDGTLTPIMPHPEEAVLSETMRATILALSKVALVAVVSGRNKNNIQDLVGLPNIFYVGNHGFDIEGPLGTDIHYEIGLDSIRMMEKCFRQLQTELMEIPGVQFEPKKLTVTIHYRHVEEKNIPLVFELIKNCVQKYPELKISAGKKVLEIRPNIDWDKGRAVLWLAEKLGLNQPHDLLIYLGDDLTDEDAFRILPPHGIGILVGNHADLTYADYHLQDPDQVKQFLDKLIKISSKYPLAY